MVRTFFLLGSGEFEPWTHEPEERLLASAIGDGRVVVLPTASSREGDDVFDRWARMGLAHYAESGVPAEVVPVKTHADAHDAGFAARVEAASMIYFSGGKPAHLAEALAGTPLLAAIERALDRGAVYAGCSAGAMVASRAHDPSKGAGTSWRFGLGFVPHASFGVHWDRVRKLPGLTWWMTSRLPDGSWFVGIDEHTAIVGDGERWEVVGLGQVVTRRSGQTAMYGPGDRFQTPPQASR